MSGGWVPATREGHALLVEIMRKRIEQIGDEVARLERERAEIAAWLELHASYDTPTGQ